MIIASSFQDKILALNEVIKRLSNFNCLIFLVTAGVMSDFDVRKDVKSYANGKGAAIFFVDSLAEAYQQRDGMLMNLLEVKRQAVDKPTEQVLRRYEMILDKAVIFF